MSAKRLREDYANGSNKKGRAGKSVEEELDWKVVLDPANFDRVTFEVSEAKKGPARTYMDFKWRRSTGRAERLAVIAPPMTVDFAKTNGAGSSPYVQKVTNKKKRDALLNDPMEYKNCVTVKQGISEQFADTMSAAGQERILVDQERFTRWLMLFDVRLYFEILWYQDNFLADDKRAALIDAAVEQEHNFDLRTNDDAARRADDDEMIVAIAKRAFFNERTSSTLIVTYNASASDNPSESRMNEPSITQLRKDMLALYDAFLKGESIDDVKLGTYDRKIKASRKAWFTSYKTKIVELPADWVTPVEEDRDDDYMFSAFKKRGYTPWTVAVQDIRTGSIPVDPTKPNVGTVPSGSLLIARVELKPWQSPAFGHGIQRRIDGTQVLLMKAAFNREEESDNTAALSRYGDFLPAPVVAPVVAPPPAALLMAVESAPMEDDEPEAAPMEDDEPEPAAKASTKKTPKKAAKKTAKKTVKPRRAPMPLSDDEEAAPED